MWPFRRKAFRTETDPAKIYINLLWVEMAKGPLPTQVTVKEKDGLPVVQHFCGNPPATRNVLRLLKMQASQQMKLSETTPSLVIGNKPVQLRFTINNGPPSSVTVRMSQFVTGMADQILA